MTHKKRYRWFKNHRSLRIKNCKAQGHSWNYTKPRFSRICMQGLIRRTCICGAEELGKWKYTKKGWVFK